MEPAAAPGADDADETADAPELELELEVFDELEEVAPRDVATERAAGAADGDAWDADAALPPAVEAPAPARWIRMRSARSWLHVEMPFCGEIGGVLQVSRCARRSRA